MRLVIDKSNGAYKVAKTIGSSSDATVLSRLVADAQLWIQQKMGLLALDFVQVDVLLEQFINGIQQIKIVGIELLLGKLFDQI